MHNSFKEQDSKIKEISEILIHDRFSKFKKKIILLIIMLHGFNAIFSKNSFMSLEMCFVSLFVNILIYQYLSIISSINTRFTTFLMICNLITPPCLILKFKYLEFNLKQGSIYTQLTPYDEIRLNLAS